MSWKESTIYQIYPASFKDSTGSGVGDLGGILSKIDYLQTLGIDMVWLCPIFESPQVDMGYDISNYREIDSRYGRVADVDELVSQLHKRSMKLLLDLVVNHTSNQHAWFRESRSSRDNPKRDWYVWRPPRIATDGSRQPPNNWQSHFQGPAWTYDEVTGEYYLHLFASAQPDLNWENQEVRAEVHRTMRFWLDRGVDGFRLDVINFISKDQRFADSDRAVLRGSEFYAAGPRLHEYLHGLGSLLAEYGAFSVGEMPCVHDPAEIIKSVGANRGELNTIFHFELVDIDHGPQGKFSPRSWTLADLRAIVAKWQHFMADNDGWNALYLENHDQPRSVSRFTHYLHDDDPDPKLLTAAAKMLAVFHGTQAGTPFIYQGQELGMSNVPAAWGMDAYQDIDCLNHWTVAQSQKQPPLDGRRRANLLREYCHKSRDNARTPMQWDASANAGFSTAEPWMRVNPNYATVNASTELNDSDSVFHCWRRVLVTRKAHKDELVYGSFALVDEHHDAVFAYTRTSSRGRVILIACNFTPQPAVWAQPRSVVEVLLSTGVRDAASLQGEVTLEPYEGVAMLVE